ncbi:MAG: phenylacetate--CoA ligase family protein [Gammaproteobacteria bacterium]|nr:MAG: phenylacetate--CoA ligase family protein [Gammaproteobacteria bacterium]
MTDFVSPRVAEPSSAVPGIDWPALPEPVGASMLALQFQLQQSQWWSLEEIRAHQLRQFQALLAHVVVQTDWYGQQAAFVELADSPEIIDEQLFSQLPLLCRSELQQNLPALTASEIPPAHGQRLDLATSGSTGTPLTGFETEINNFFWGGCNLRDHLWHDRDLSAKFAAIRTKVDQQTLPDWGRAIACAFNTGPAVTLDIATPVTDQVDWLVAQQPGYLLSHASNLQALARQILAMGTEVESLQGIISFGEKLPADLRALCDQAWNATLTDIYSAEEVGYIALQCPSEPAHYHVMAEQLIVEIIDAEGNPCEPGQWGEVVITSLHNFAMPLIRYRIGDFARVGEVCGCDRGLPVITEIMGRGRNMITLPDGSQHWPSFPAELWLGVAPIQQLQLEQLSRQQILVHYQLERPLSLDQSAQLRRQLAESLHYPGSIEFEHHLAPLTEPGQKFEDFVSRL